MDKTFTTTDSILTVKNDFVNNVIKCSPSLGSLPHTYYYIPNEVYKLYGQNHERFEKAVEEAKEEKERQELLKTQIRNKRLRGLVKHIHWSGNCCIVYWNDGTQTKSYWNTEEDFDAEKAILVCMARKLYENTNIYNEVIAKYEQDGWDHYEEEKIWAQYV